MHELVVGNGIAIAEHHGRHLRIEQRGRDHLRLVPADLDVLAGGVEDLDYPLVGQQVEQGAKLDSRGQRVDHDQFVDARHLEHAELGVIGALAQEFGVDRHKWMPRKAGAGFGQCFCICDRLHSGG